MLALRNADAAGDEEAAKRIAAMIKQQQVSAAAIEPVQEPDVVAAQPEPQGLDEIGSARELNELSFPAFKASAGLLVTDSDESSKSLLKDQFGDSVSFSDSPDGVVATFPSGSYLLNKKGLSGQDIIKFAADALAFTPAGRAGTIAGAVGKSALTEAALEGTEESLGGEEASAKDIGLAAGLGGLFKGAENVIGAGYRAITGQGDDAANAIIKAGEDAGIPVTTTDVLPPQTFSGKSAQQIGEKIPFAGTATMREEQQLLRQKAVDDVAERYGQFSYSSIVDSLKAKKDKIKSAAGSVLQSTGEKLDGAGEISIPNTKSAISEVQEELSKQGVIQSTGAIDDLSKLADAISSAPQTFTTLKENRTAFREIIAGADKAERSQLTSRSKALLQKVGNALTKDMDSFAKSNLTKQEFLKWKNANEIYAEEARALTKTKLKNILDKGDVTPESVSSMLFSQKPSELKALYSGLGTYGRANARAAIISKIIGNVSRRTDGLTPNSFSTEFKKFEPQINEFFKGEEKRQLIGLQKALNATRRAQDASATSVTGQQLIPVATGAAAIADLGSTILLGGTTGGIARLYESAPVRSALLKLSSVSKGSTQFEKALLDLQTALSSSAQALREE